MLLKEWLEKTGTTPYELAKRTGIDHSLIYHAIRNKQRMSLETAKKVEAATGGEVWCLEARYPDLFEGVVITKRESKNEV